MFIFTFETVYVSRSFTISNVRKNKFAIDFNGLFFKKNFCVATDTAVLDFW